MRKIRIPFQSLPTAFLAAYVVCADVLLFFAVVPFELYCLHAVHAHPGNLGFGIEVLAANGAVVGMMACSMGAGAALLSRGVAAYGLEKLLPSKRLAAASVRARQDDDQPLTRG